jgi:D-arabinose 1-dehydrogenase-like Zn-dependent alcohol dehydrogenase
MRHRRVVVSQHGGPDVLPVVEGRIKPVVAERFPLAEAARAHELLARGGYAGKVVLVTKLAEPGR